MRITCKETRGYKLKKGKTYEVLEEHENRYKVTNEAGLDRKYSKKLFNIVQERLDIKEVFKSICIVEDEVQFRTYKNDEIILEVKDFVTLRDSHISCGVKELPRINGLVDIVVKTVQDEFGHKSGNQYEELVAAILWKCIECAAELDVQQYKFLLISTNTNDNGNSSRNNNYDHICRAISLKGESIQLIGNNPNTNNEICIWTLDVEECFKG